MNKLNKKAFTLVELLAVIMIIGIIALIGGYGVSSVIQASKKKAYDQQVEKIINAAKEWAVENTQALPEKDSICVTLDTLKAAGKIDQIPINPEDNTNMNGAVEIACINNCLSYTYEYSKLPNCGIVPKVCTATKGTGLNLSDEITCGTESFYVMSSDDTTITMMSKYNLNVGNDKAAGTEGIQLTEISSKGYVDFMGDPSEATGFQDYVNNYLTYLKGTVGLNEATTATLISKDELVEIGCDVPYAAVGVEGVLACTNAPAWIIDTNYFTSTLDLVDPDVGPSSIWLINNDGIQNIYSKILELTNPVSAGIRPVVTILKTDI